MSGTGMCSGEGRMLPEERAEDRRFFTNWFQRASASPSINSPSFKPFISRQAKAQNPELMVISHRNEQIEELPQCAAIPRRNMQ